MIHFTFLISFYAMASSKVLDSLVKRRIENLDTSIDYFVSRLASLRRARVKRASEINSDEYQLTEVQGYDLEIKLLEDVVSYLKLC